MAVPLIAMAAKALASRAAGAAADQAAAAVGASSGQDLQKKAGWVAAGAGLVALFMFLAILAGMIGSLAGSATAASDCSSSGSGGQIGDIPPDYLVLYQDAALLVPGLDWSYIAAIGKIETDHGRSTLPGVQSGTNAYGAAGPMQFLLSTWKNAGVDGDGDGDMDVYDPADAIPAAAAYLQAHGAPTNMHDAIWAYNHAEWYVQDVMAQAELYRNTPPVGAAAQASFAAPASAAPAAPALPGPTESPLVAAPAFVITTSQCGGSGATFSGGGSGPWGGYFNGQIPTSALCAVSASEFLRCDAASAFLAMSAAYAASFGAPICITDGYRSLAEQILVKKEKPTLAATPGTSNHGWGLATDLGCGINNFGTAQHSWMKANAGQFGFMHPGWAQQGGSKPEAWHWEFGAL